MEQLVPVIEFCKKHRFWLICGIIAVAMTVTWYLATSRITAEMARNSSDIQRKIQLNETIR